MELDIIRASLKALLSIHVIAEHYSVELKVEE
jgi:hypothetical protein